MYVNVWWNLGQVLVELFDVNDLEADEEDDGSGAELDVLSCPYEDPGHVLLGRLCPQPTPSLTPSSSQPQQRERVTTLHAEILSVNFEQFLHACKYLLTMLLLHTCCIHICSTKSIGTGTMHPIGRNF